MNNEDDDLHQPSTSRAVLSSQKSSECLKESSSLNNNVVNGCPDSECCFDCDMAAQHDHMIAASLVYCDQEENNSDDDCCIYTYRGDRQGLEVNNLPMSDRSSSPLMDYLEMDFEPEITAGEDEEVVLVNVANDDNEPEEDPVPSFSGVNNIEEENLNDVRTVVNNLVDKPTPELQDTNTNLPVNNNSINLNGISAPPAKEERNGCLRRTGDTLEVCQKMKRMRVDDLTWVKEMVWSENDAAQMQFSQIGVSACGTTAVINTLLALRIPFSIDRIIRTIGTRLRDETAPLVSYLESRAVAGCMPQDLVRTLETATDSLISARFFATHQNLETPLAPWLASWIKKGAIPILTLNRQRGVVTSHTLVPDSWHHQMMYGIAYNPLRTECAQIYLTNPLCQYSLDVLRPQLISPSTLMIKRADILSRWTPQTDLMSLATHPNRHWHRFNVLGQVVNLLREEKESVQFTNHIVIPANYKSGITLAMRSSSNYSHELKSVPEL